MSIFSVGGGSATDDFELEQSLRFNRADGAYQSRTFSASNRKTWTWSGWFKLADPSVADGSVGHRRLFGVNTGNSDSTTFELGINQNNKLNATGWNNNFRTTTAVYRDPGQWYHCVWVFDSTDSTADDRLKLYVNGERVTDFDNSYTVTQDADYGINQAGTHYVGYAGSGTVSSYSWDGYLAEMHFIDGQALTPASFGETNSATNQWVPIEVTGMTYGTNGFYLPFSATELANSFTSDNTTSFIDAYTSGSGNWTCPAGVTSVEVLVVAGGGGGGGLGGGGGGGGVVHQTNRTVVPGNTYAYSVGSGGTGGPGYNQSNGTSGGNSTFDTITAVGGGGGSSGPASGGSGGSGGGGNGGYSSNGGSGTQADSGGGTGYGNDGGNGAGGNYYGGGGGGAGGAGGNGNSPSGYTGAGGAAREFSNFSSYGVSGFFAGGGSGGGGSGTTAGTAGAGGGTGSVSAPSAGGNGTANTGGGGGGGPNETATRAGHGGSGVVLIRYTGAPTVTANGDVANTRGTNLGTTFKVIDSYTSTGSHTWTCPSGITSIEVLTVAGGGGGAGYYGGGGGGAGGIVHQTDYTVVPGTVYDLTVGAGGAADPGATAQGNDGSDSVWNVNAEGSGLTHTAKGGGGGGGYANPPGPDGRPGGSGGGSNSRYGNQPGNAGDGGSSTQASFSGATSYGNVGGSNSTTLATESAGSGGGGAGQAGNVTRSAGSPSADQGGTGGNGVYFSTFASYGVSGYFGGGGGGGGGNTSGPRDGGDGGTGGGGHGGTHNTTAAGNGTANTGGGGGGASQHNSSPGSTGGGGGSGVILIAYDKSKPGQSSIEFDGTGDYLTAPSSNDWDFGTGDFTLEMWLRFANKNTGSGASGANALLANHNSPNGWQWIWRGSDNTFELWSTDQDEYASSFTLNNDTWYHVAVTRDGNTLRHYVDGVQCGSNAFTETMSNTSTTLQIGSYDQSGLGLIDGYMDEIRISDTCRYPDGTTFTPSTTAFTADSNTKLLIHSDFNGGIGADSSGNTNDFSATNLVATDQVLDSPTNNFATLNPLNVPTSSAPTFSEGNLQSVDAAGWGGSSTIEQSSGKWYAEFLVKTYSSTEQHVVGVVNDAAKTANANEYPGRYDSGFGYYGNDGKSVTNGTFSSYGNTYTTGDIIGVALNLDDDELKFYKNGTVQNSGTAISITANKSYAFAVGNAAGAPTTTWIANFGQDSSFAGNKTAQGNQDGNGKGDFYYTPPGSGSNAYLALCSDNLSDPSIADPTAHFNTVLYTGNGSSTQAITGVGFQPDFLWLKSRNALENHMLADVVRGSTKRLISNATNAEDSNGVNSFDSDGFTTLTGGVWNTSGRTYASWNWKAGGTASSNTDGSITSSVSANPTAGFSIVSYTGTGSAATVGHGLSQAPELVIVKERETAGFDWLVYSDPVGATKNLRLNLTNAEGTSSGFWNDTAPTSTVFSIGSSNDVSYSGKGIIAYCFHGIDGYSKVGSYEGNANADGPFVYTGFKPAFVMIKQTTTANWFVFDDARNTYNVVDNTLKPSTSGAETDVNSLDFVSNGFKIRHNSATSSINDNGISVIYLAMASTSFKTSNAR